MTRPSSLLDGRARKMLRPQPQETSLTPVPSRSFQKPIARSLNILPPRPAQPKGWTHAVRRSRGQELHLRLLHSGPSSLLSNSAQSPSTSRRRSARPWGCCPPPVASPPTQRTPLLTNPAPPPSANAAQARPESRAASTTSD